MRTWDLKYRFWNAEPALVG